MPETYKNNKFYFYSLYNLNIGIVPNLKDIFSPESAFVFNKIKAYFKYISLFFRLLGLEIIFSLFCVQKKKNIRENGIVLENEFYEYCDKL